MPFSFAIQSEKKEYVYGNMGGKNVLSGVIERTIVEEGLIVYDGAVGQIVLAMAAFGPVKIDEWFGEGSAFRLWQRSKELSGVYDDEGNVLGVGYINEHDRISVVWSAGTILATREIGSLLGGTPMIRRL